MNIQDWLCELGYRESQQDEAFIKPPCYTNGWEQQSIPFSAIAGHTLESFKKLAEKEGWVEKTAKIVTGCLTLSAEKMTVGKLDATKFQLKKICSDANETNWVNTAIVYEDPPPSLTLSHFTVEMSKYNAPDGTERGMATLAWKNPDPIAVDFAYVEAAYRESGSAPFYVFVEVIGPPEPVYALGLDAGILYDFRIRARTKNGVPGPALMITDQSVTKE